MPLIRRESLRPGAPTLFLLHGLGSNADDLYGLASPLSLPYSIISLQAPDSFSEGFSWFPIGWSEAGVTLDAQIARTRADDLRKAFVAYPRPWIVAGFSQGAMMTALLLAEHPESLDGAVMMAGLLLPEVVVTPGPRRPALILHGRQDPVVPFPEGERLRESLRDVHDVEFSSDDVGHTVSMAQAISLSIWLKRHFS